MIAESMLLTLALVYAGLLFGVAWFVDHRPALSNRLHPIIYALSLSIYCSSWTFYGAVGSAAIQPWQHAPIYLGPILVYLLAWPIIKRLITIGAQQRATSIADFISSRYGKHRRIAILVTLVATATVLPYVALQLKAVAQTWYLITGTDTSAAVTTHSTLVTAVTMALFTILFGTRRLHSDERHTGMMAAIAIESLVKLLVFALVAGLAITYLATQLPTEKLIQTLEPWQSVHASPDFYAQIVLSMCAIACLPRQFHVTVVEYQQEPDSTWGRWLLVVYLTAFLLFAAPLSIAGSQLLSATAINPDTYVQHLPIALNQRIIAIAAFIGGISAATGMAIVATTSLAIMVTNEVLAPLLIKYNTNPLKGIANLGDRLLLSRQLSIAAIFLLAWLTAGHIDHLPRLTDIGFLSFLAAAQLAPALLAGIYWHRSNVLGAGAGISAGLVLWVYCALLPALLSADHALLAEGPLGLSWLRPTQLFNTLPEYQLAHATVWSLAINAGLLVLISLSTQTSTRDQRQAKRFLDFGTPTDQLYDVDFSQSSVRAGQIKTLLVAFAKDQAETTWREFESIYQQRLLPDDRVPQFVLNRVEAVLASDIGATSAGRIMKQLAASQQIGLHDFVDIIGGTNKHYQFTQDVLQTTFETVSQGISVVDSSHNLVAWNDSYEQIFSYPPRLLYVGCPIEKVYRFNAERGLIITQETIENTVNKRMNRLTAGNPYRLEHTLPNGVVIDICGNPMPNGGFVTTYLDITEYKNTLDDLHEARQALELRVESGVEALSKSNANLRRENQLRAKAENKLREAHRSKSRFMSATSHDLLQPINAARLFTASLKALQKDNEDPSQRTIVDHIDRSLTNAEDLINALREIARLDSGKQHPARVNFNAKPFLEQLATQFQLTASTKRLAFHCHPSSLWLYSDPNLLRRIMQNLLSNAIRYTSTGRVVIGCRRHQKHLSLEVWDTGHGIPESEQQRIFAEFERLEQPGHQSDEGLGLGLAIVERCANLLNHRVTLHSQPGQGTVFKVLVPLGEAEPIQTSAATELQGCKVLIISDHTDSLNDLPTRLKQWGCLVTTANNHEEADHYFQAQPPTIVLAPHHISEDESGSDLVCALNRRHGHNARGLIITNDGAVAASDQLKAAECYAITQPINPGRLKALIRQLSALDT